jgi:hypothetical protein
MPHAMTSIFLASVAAFVCAALYVAVRLLPALMALGGLAIVAVATSSVRESSLARNALVSAVALFVGILIGRAVRSRAALVVFVLVASVADQMSYLLGPTRALLTGNLRARRYLAHLRWHSGFNPFHRLLCGNAPLPIPRLGGISHPAVRYSRSSGSPSCHWSTAGAALPRVGCSCVSVFRTSAQRT